MSDKKATEGKQKIDTIRHSLAHIMAAAIQELFPGTKFGIGPVIKNGFYYDFDLKNGLASDDLPKTEAKMREFIKQDIAFKKKLISKKETERIFKNQPYKLELIKEVPGKKVSTYESGKFLDLCLGPHVKSTKEIPPDSFKLTKIAGAYWRGSEKNPMLTRIYGVAFANKKELNNYLRLQTEIEKRNHRKLGTQLDLFSFHEVSPGAAFWHPKGMIIIKELEKWWRQEHEKRGYLETSTPTIVKKELFEQSGHWKHYKENIFTFDVEGQIFVLKPMNCPESTIIYSSKIRSYKDLPLRLSEIGNLYRNELSGVLAGLFRVRQLTMDDAHIYCTPEQIQTEIKNILKFIQEFYRLFKLNPEFKLATRPENYMGDKKLWKKAEKALEFSLKQRKIKYELKPKDGAFYGPKIDVHITDALERSWQIATVQLDFQMPERFQLTYIDQKGRKKRPVIIHRAIFGSFERFIGILLEHYAGALPLWLSPIQIWIIPVGSRHKKYAKTLKEKLSALSIRVETKDTAETVSKKIRDGELQKIPYLLVVGDKEMAKKGVRVREKGKGDIGVMKLNKFLERVRKEIKGKK
ncbi:threonine--tRNA ligase [Patescibacteria group bacterium]|nr:threonine--tRNA ligase [Patescibacteria group bacterium]